METTSKKKIIPSTAIKSEEISKLRKNSTKNSGGQQNDKKAHTSTPNEDTEKTKKRIYDKIGSAKELQTIKKANGNK